MPSSHAFPRPDVARSSNWLKRGGEHDDDTRPEHNGRRSSTLAAGVVRVRFASMRRGAKPIPSVTCGAPAVAMHPAAPLDPPRRAFPDRVGVHDQSDHHRRIVRRAAVAVGAIRSQKRRQIELADRVDHESREVVLGQPLPQAGRQQQDLLAITRQEVLRHPAIVLNDPDETPIRRPTASPNAPTQPSAPAASDRSTPPTRHLAGSRTPDPTNASAACPKHANRDRPRPAPQTACADPRRHLRAPKAHDIARRARICATATMESDSHIRTVWQAVVRRQVEQRTSLERSPSAVPAVQLVGRDAMPARREHRSRVGLPLRSAPGAPS